MVILIKMDRYAAGLYIFRSFSSTYSSCGRTGWLPSRLKTFLLFPSVEVASGGNIHQIAVEDIVG